MRHLLIGNSDGIGWALTRALAARGDELVSVSRSPLPNPIDGCTHHVIDVAAPGYPQQITDLCRGEQFDSCVYLAGIGLGFDANALSNDRKVIDVNFNAVLHTVEACLPPMLERGHGHFMALSSIADTLVLDEAVSYCTSKAALTRYLSSLGMALRKTDVAITNVRFGFVDTKMAEAPIKPRMITTEKAARLLLRCLEKKPLQYTYPKSMGLLVWMLRAYSNLRILTQRWR